MRENCTVAVSRSDESEQELKFEVVVSCNKRSSFHHVTLQKDDYMSISSALVSEEQFVKDCFEFLLGNESQEMILLEFDISVIENYFPDFKEEMYEKYHKTTEDESFLKRVLFRS